MPGNAALTRSTPQHVDEEAHQFVRLAREGARAGGQARIILEQFGEMARHHAGAGAGGRDDVIDVGERIHHLQGEIARRAAVARVEGRLAAAGLRGHAHLAACVLEQLHGRKPDRGPEQVDQTGDEEAHAGR